MAGELEKVGVEAVVEGLSSFIGDTKKINSSLQGIRGEGTLLQRAFGAVGESIANFGRSAIRVAEVALGVLLRDAIRAAIDAVKELISSTIDAGNEFQVLEIRLKRLNFNTLVESGEDYNEAAREAVKLTKDQLQWLTLLAAKSPYDATDVANVFTLARTYGFAGDQAKEMTKDILNFSSGMGLTNQEVTRVIVNFGQMVQQGKVTQRELNDLARGAFVPVNDVLEIMSEQTGVAMDAMDDFRKTGESVPAFMKAFSTLVETRFAGATEEMSQTFMSSIDNIKDLVQGIFGLNAVKPVLDIIGKKASEFANAFTDKPERWDRIVEAASRIGEAFSGVVTGILDLIPGADAMADGVVSGFEGIATWIENNQENIIGFFADIRDSIREDVAPFIKDVLVPAFDRLKKWVEDNENVFILFFQSIEEIAGDVFENFFGGSAGLSGGEDFLDLITGIMDFVIMNREEISEWAIKLGDLFIKWQIITTVLNIVGGFLLSIAGFILGAIAAVSGFIGIINTLGVVLGVLLSPIGLLIAGIIAIAVIIATKGDEIGETISQMAFIVKFKLTKLKDEAIALVMAIMITFARVWSSINRNIRDQWNKIVDFFRGAIDRIKSALMIDWTSVGKNIVLGIANGISSFGGVIANAARNAALNAFAAAKAALGISSPSKLFMNIGAQTMEGLAIGIQKSAGIAAATMQGAMASVSSAAVPSVTNSTVVNNSNAYNLTVNSGANTEPILQDFDMMQSLAGA